MHKRVILIATVLATAPVGINGPNQRQISRLQDGVHIFYACSLSQTTFVP
jgi:hypothetical protein